MANNVTENIKLADREGWFEQEKVLKELISQLTNVLGKANKEMLAKVEESRRLEGKVTKLNIKQAHPQNRNEAEDKNAPIVGSQIARDSISIFPEEVWELIFDKLTDWEDVKSCSQVCILFQKVLHPYNTTFLFGEVFPSIFKYMDGDEVLKCRAVCKAWKNGVDSHLEDHKSLRPHDEERQSYHQRSADAAPFITPLQSKELGDRFTCPLIPTYKYWLENRRTQFLDKIRTTGDRSFNPIIGRNLLLEEDEKSQEFIKAFGKHIWYLTLDDWSMEKILKLVDLDRELLPGLRKLHIAGQSTYNNGDMKNPDAILKTQAIPIGLETLVFDYQLHAPVLDVFLKRYHLLLGRLEISSGRDNWESFANLDWHNLKELHVDALQDVDCLLEVDLPNLQKLGLSWRIGDNPRDPGIDDILSIVYKLSARTRLNTLRLAGNIPSNLDLSGEHVYAPVSLKTLELEHSYYDEYHIWYTILLHFPFLENVNVFWRKFECPNRHLHQLATVVDELGSDSEDDKDSEDDEDNDPSAKKGRVNYCDVPEQGRETRGMKILEEKRIRWELVEVHSHLEYKDGMFYSNIWKLLPRLKLFTFGKEVYTRERSQKINGCETSKEAK